MRVFLSCCAIVSILICAAGCKRDRSASDPMSRFIPPGTSQVVKLGDPAQLKTDLDRNELASILKEKRLFEYLGREAGLLTQIRSDSFTYLFDTRPISNRYKLVARNVRSQTEADSTQGLRIRQTEQDGVWLDHLSLQGDTLYRVIRDSISLYAPSPEGAAQLLRQYDKNESFPSELLKLHNQKNLAVYERQPQIYIEDSTALPLADTRLLELGITASQFTIRGVARAQDSMPDLVESFKGQQPERSRLFEILPLEAPGGRSFTYQDARTLVNKLSELRHDSLRANYPLLLETFSEIGQLDLEEGEAIFAVSVDPALTEEQWQGTLAENGVFRDVQLYSMEDPGFFGSWLHPLVSEIQPRLSFRLGDIFFFADGPDTAKMLITAYQNKNVLAMSPLLDDIQPDVLDRISWQFIHQGTRVGKGLFQALGYAPADTGLKQIGGYRLGVLQAAGEKDFAHLNYVSKEASGSRRLSPVLSQLATITLETPLMSDVQLFSNHRTGGKDIVFQDLNNDLSLYSSSGKRLWKKRLQGPLLGRIHEVDILRNGKKQLAFTTTNALHVIDRNGNAVAPFPIRFKDSITQPLSVFDYDNNRKYRFAIVQGKEILLYDSKGKVVKGFRFRTAGSPIVLPAQHIRIGNKDYVILAEESGQLNILSRVGRTRVDVTKRFDFSDNPIAREGESFVVITREKTKETINTSGKVTSRPIEVSSDFFFTINRRVKVSLDENVLRINGRAIELPFGLYSKPEVFALGGTVIVGLTETQEKKVYLYDNRGELLSGLPAYGADTPDLGRSRSDGTLMLVKGDDRQILLYRLQN